MTVRATSIAALCEVLFAALMAAFALSIPTQPSEGENSALLILVVQTGLALLAAVGLFRAKWWGWLVALGVIVIVFGPVGLSIYRAWRAGIGVGVMMPANTVILVAVGWFAQVVVAVCFLVARIWRRSTPGTA
jgi:hypothetical protein